MSEVFCAKLLFRVGFRRRLRGFHYDIVRKANRKGPGRPGHGRLTGCHGNSKEVTTKQLHLSKRKSREPECKQVAPRSHLHTLACVGSDRLRAGNDWWPGLVRNFGSSERLRTMAAQHQACSLQEARHLRNARCRLQRRPMMHWDRTKDRDKKCWIQMATHAANSCETSSGQQLPETDNLNDSKKCQWKNWKTEIFWEMSGVEHSWENSVFQFSH